MSAQPSAAVVARAPATPGAVPGAAILERGLDEAARLPADALARVAVPAAIAPAAGLWRLAGDAVLWEARDEELAIAGVGVAEIEAARFASQLARGISLQQLNLFLNGLVRF